MKLVFLGPPGAGKGTQAKRLCRSRGFAHISTGDILRAAVAEGTPLGLEAKSYMDSGGLVPDDVISGLVAERIREPDCEPGWLLDGFPRTDGQADALDKTLSELGATVDACVLFELETETVVERLSGRLVCGSCGAIFHRSFRPPQQDGVCDNCGKPSLAQRTDDNETSVRKRLEVYEDLTRGLIDFYEQRSQLRRIEASGTPDEVTARVEAVLGGS